MLLESLTSMVRIWKYTKSDDEKILGVLVLGVLSI